MRLSHVTLRVADVPRARAFYLLMGFELIVDEPQYCRFLTRGPAGGGDETLSIEHGVGVGGGHVQLGLEFESAAALDAWVAHLATRGVSIVEGPIDRSWLWRDARVLDPDGHEWMLFHAGTNKLDPPWRVKRAR